MFKPQPMLAMRMAAYLAIGQAVLWVLLLGRWMTFDLFGWTPLPAELFLAQWPPGMVYLLYGLLFLADAILAIGLLAQSKWAYPAGWGRAVFGLLLGLGYFGLSREFYGAVLLIGLAGLLLVLLWNRAAYALAFPAGYWLFLFFLLPLLIVFVVSLGERSRVGTVIYPPFNLSQYLNDYVRFFSPVNGDFIYLRIFWRSLLMAIFNTLFCLLLGYPFAYWIARRPEKYRNTLIFLVMIPFWTNFLVRTYAWMLLLRDSGVINNFWTITLHEQALALSGRSPLFNWLADLTADKLPLLFNTPAVMVGLLYGYLPFMVLPLYTTLEKLDWSLLEAAADLGAGRWQSLTRVLIPLTLPGITAGCIIVFIPSLGAYVTPDLMGGAKVALLGNLLQQQFMTVRDWPFGSAIGFILMTIMLVATLFYFRLLQREEQAGGG